MAVTRWDGKVIPEQLTRALSSQACTSKDLWLPVKSTRRQLELDEGCIIVDDSIVKKPWMDKNELSCWHYDHSKGRHVKGINLFNYLSPVGEIPIPIAFELVLKPLVYGEINTWPEKPLREVTNNELMRNWFDTRVQNTVKFRLVLFDSGCSSVENMEHIKLKPSQVFQKLLKSNAAVAKSPARRLASTSPPGVRIYSCRFQKGTVENAHQTQSFCLEVAIVPEGGSRCLRGVTTTADCVTSVNQAGSYEELVAPEGAFAQLAQRQLL